MSNEVKTMKIKVLRAFRMSGLDPSTPKCENGVAGVGAVLTIPRSLGLMLISAKKAEETNEMEKKGVAPAVGAPQPAKKGA